jgi:hypothetical protein
MLANDITFAAGPLVPLSAMRTGRRCTDVPQPDLWFAGHHKRYSRKARQGTPKRSGRRIDRQSKVQLIRVSVTPAREYNPDLID